MFPVHCIDLISSPRMVFDQPTFLVRVNNYTVSARSAGLYGPFNAGMPYSALKGTG